MRQVLVVIARRHAGGDGFAERINGGRFLGGQTPERCATEPGLIKTAGFILVGVAKAAGEIKARQHMPGCLAVGGVAVGDRIGISLNVESIEGQIADRRWHFRPKYIGAGLRPVPGARIARHILVEEIRTGGIVHRAAGGRGNTKFLRGLALPFLDRPVVGDFQVLLDLRAIERPPVPEPPSRYGCQREAV